MKADMIMILIVVLPLTTTTATTEGAHISTQAIHSADYIEVDPQDMGQPQ